MFVGDVFEEVVVEHAADALEQANVDIVVRKDFVDVRACTTNLRGEPRYRVSVFFEFGANKLSYMDRHRYYAAGVPVTRFVLMQKRRATSDYLN